MVNRAYLQMIDLDLFFRFLKGRCHGNRFRKNFSTNVYSEQRHPKMDCDIAISIQKYSMAIS